MPKYPDDDDYLSRQEIDDLRSEAKHPAKYMKAFFDFKIEARYSFSVNWSAEDREFVGLYAQGYTRATGNYRDWETDRKSVV